MLWSIFIQNVVCLMLHKYLYWWWQCDDDDDDDNDDNDDVKLFSMWLKICLSLNFTSSCLHTSNYCWKKLKNTT